MGDSAAVTAGAPPSVNRHHEHPSPKLHRALILPELLLQVFSLLDQDSNASNARVCKVWSSFALDAVWRRVDCSVFLSLVDSVYHDIEADGWEDQLVLDLPRPITSRDWERFLLNSTRVHEYFEDFRTPLLSPRFVSELAMTRPNVVLFPHLIHIETFATQLHLFIMNDSVKKLRLELEPLDDDDTDESYEGVAGSLSSLSYYIPDRMPHIEDLRFYSKSSTHARFDESLSRIIASLSQISTLALPEYWFSSPIAQAISGSGRLQKLITCYYIVRPDPDFAVEEWRPRLSFPVEIGAFSSLSVLKLAVASLGDATPMLEQPNFPAQRLTHFTILCPLLPAVNELSAELVRLAGVLTSMTDLTLAFVRQEYHNAAELQDVSPITYEDLLQLKAFPHLIAFDLYHPHLVRITDDRLEDLVQDWSTLRSFSLNSHPTVATKSQLTLRSLITLPTYCPEIDDLGLYLDVVSVPEAGPSFPRLSNCTVLRIMGSPISPRFDDSHIDIARFLASILTEEICFRKSTEDEVVPKTSGSWLHELSGQTASTSAIENAWSIIASTTEAIIKEVQRERRNVIATNRENAILRKELDRLRSRLTSTQVFA